MAGKTKSAEMDLLHGPVAETLLRFSFPFMLSTLLQTLYATADTIIVGQFLGSAGLDAFAGRMFLCWFLGVFLNIGAFGFFMGYTMGPI